MSQDEELALMVQLDNLFPYEDQIGTDWDSHWVRLIPFIRTREATLIREARIDELKAISSTNHSAISAKSGKIGEWISIPNRIAELTNQQKGEQ